MKAPKCKYCHKIGHYESSCWKKAWDYRLNRGKMRSKASNSRSKASSGSKVGKLLSSEQNERRKLIKELDRVTSLVVRLGSADQSGKVECFTCSRRLPIAQIDNGHFHRRRRMATRWDLDNLRPQCLTRGHKVGDKDISEIKVGDEVPSLFGKARVVAVRQFRSPIIELEYEGGMVRSSPEHKILVESQDRLVWLSAQQISDLLKKGVGCNIIRA